MIQDPEGEDDRLVDENGDDYSDLAEEEIIEDSEAPQAAAPVTNQGEGQQAASNSWIWITVIILVVVAATLITIIAVRKENQSELINKKGR